jgi:hypothetical protein
MKCSACGYDNSYILKVGIEQKPFMQAVYHGTTVENAENILKEGLREFSHYTPFLSTALSQGGPVVFIWYILDWQFQVAIKRGEWQFRTEKTVKPDEFVAVVHYKDVDLIKYNKKQSYKLRLEAKPDLCRRCRGSGNLYYLDDGYGYLPKGSSSKTANRKIKICPDCHGYGDLEEWRKIRG